jgi:hypothetical protein
MLYHLLSKITAVILASLGAFPKLQKVTISSIMFVHLSVCVHVEQLGTLCRHFHEI